MLEDSEPEAVHSIEDDPLDCGMRSSSEAESDYHKPKQSTYLSLTVTIAITHGRNCIMIEVCIIYTVSISLCYLTCY